MSALNKRIKDMRIAKGFTLLEVAEYLGVKEATMQRYESGNIKNIKHNTICSLAELFKCNPAYLMGWTDEPYSENSFSVTKVERHIIELFRSLNDEGQEKILQYAEDIVASGNYKKHSALGMVQES